VAADGTGVGYPGTREVYLSASLSSLPVVPSLAVYYDFGEVDSFYALASLGYSSKLTDALSLGLSASLGYAAAGYNAFYFGVDAAALNDANLGATLAWSPCPCLTVTPAYQYTLLVNSDIEDGAAGLYKDKDQSVVSVKATYTF
jgi:outer membrane scaffolding protein for murein synthesis (MipA/OmpV family)